MEGKYAVKLSITELFKISRKWRKRYNGRLWKMQMSFDSCWCGDKVLGAKQWSLLFWVTNDAIPTCLSRNRINLNNSQHLYCPYVLMPMIKDATNKNYITSLTSQRGLYLREHHASWYCSSVCYSAMFLCQGWFSARQKGISGLPMAEIGQKVFMPVTNCFCQTETATVEYLYLPPKGHTSQSVTSIHN